MSGAGFDATCHRGGVVDLDDVGDMGADVGASFCASFSRFFAVKGGSDTMDSSSGLRCPFGL